MGFLGLLGFLAKAALGYCPKLLTFRFVVNLGAGVVPAGQCSLRKSNRLDLLMSKHDQVQAGF